MSEITKNQIKVIRSLQQKKYRKEKNLFVVEGIKNVDELITSNFEIENVFCLQGFSDKYNNGIVVSEKELKQMSFLKTPDNVLAVVKIPNYTAWDEKGIILALDTINDPGNLGTIIRVADWYGVNTIICSEDTVDCFNNKVVQAAKGSIFRVKVLYKNLVPIFTNTKLPIYGATLKGKNINSIDIKEGYIVMGNESNGISNEIEKLLTDQVSIQKYGKAESLNVAMATGIVLHQVISNIN